MYETGTYVIVLSEAMRDIFKERMAQDAKWGVQNHGPLMWLAILLEEVGEFSKATVDEWCKGPSPNIRNEAVQVAAVALAIVECCDRNQWVKPDV
jgi:NTP pyrophosphatase (non-canonical NTP hydrolase)